MHAYGWTWKTHARKCVISWEPVCEMGLQTSKALWLLKISPVTGFHFRGKMLLKFPMTAENWQILILIRQFSFCFIDLIHFRANIRTIFALKNKLWLEINRSPKKLCSYWQNPEKLLEKSSNIFGQHLPFAKYFLAFEATAFAEDKLTWNFFRAFRLSS